jgi:hypothetical protein
LFEGRGPRIAEAVADTDETLKTALLWSVCYEMVDRHLRNLPAVRIVTYESLAGAPLPAFQSLYRWLDLPMTDRARQRIVAATSAATPHRRPFRWTGASKTAYQPMDSRANLETYRQRLTPEQIATIDRVTASIRSRFYPDPEPDPQLLG